VRSIIETREREESFFFDLGEKSLKRAEREREREREREMVLIITEIDGSDFGWEINRRVVVK